MNKLFPVLLGCLFACTSISSAGESFNPDEQMLREKIESTDTDLKMNDYNWVILRKSVQVLTNTSVRGRDEVRLVWSEIKNLKFSPVFANGDRPTSNFEGDLIVHLIDMPLCTGIVVHLKGQIWKDRDGKQDDRLESFQIKFDPQAWKQCV